MWSRCVSLVSKSILEWLRIKAFSPLKRKYKLAVFLNQIILLRILEIPSEVKYMVLVPLMNESLFI